MRRERGHAMLELAACAAVLVSFLGGTVQFGYTFYVYNQLVTAVGNGARYASMRTYRAATTKDVEKGNDAIRNMVAYGMPHPAAGAAPAVTNLAPSNVQVKWTLDSAGAPEFVDISLVNMKVNAVFGNFTFTGRPGFQFPYLGRYAPSETER